MARRRAAARPRIERLARETFGWDELRPGQLEAVPSVTRRRDTLVVMTTGSGKSAIYQLAVGSRVRHTEWGEGVVQRYDGEGMVLLFDSVGYKTLSVDLVAERDLLEPCT